MYIYYPTQKLFLQRKISRPICHISRSINTDTKKSLGRHYLCDKRNENLRALLICSKKSVQQMFH